MLFLEQVFLLFLRRDSKTWAFSFEKFKSRSKPFNSICVNFCVSPISDVVYRILVLLLLNWSKPDEKSNDIGGTGTAKSCGTIIIADMISMYRIFPFYAIVAFLFKLNRSSCLLD